MVNMPVKTHFAHSFGRLTPLHYSICVVGVSNTLTWREGKAEMKQTLIACPLSSTL